MLNEIQTRLFALQDLTYKDFQCRLMPTVDPDTVIGVRVPGLRALAGELSRDPAAAAAVQIFLTELPHKYYEENNLHAFLLERIRDWAACVAAVDAFLPYVDNWATCDSMTPPVFKKHLPELLAKIREWTASDKTYTIRFGVEMLMAFYLDDAFLPDYPDLVAGIRSDEYYVNMMLAWYFATALAKQFDSVIPFLENRRLSPWVHNKAIQKAIESRRIPAETKAYLRSLKIR